MRPQATMRPLSKICASCLKARHNTRSFSSRTRLTRKDERAFNGIQTQRNMMRTCISSVRPASGHPGSRNSATQTKPLPFYALFPQTLHQGSPPSGPFAIDSRALRQEYLRLQAASHPDLHRHQQLSSTSETTDSEGSATGGSNSQNTTSALINNAYRTLLSPLSRAQYILRERHGIDLEGDEAGKLAGPVDPFVLEQVMLAREQIEDAVKEDDLEAVRLENEQRIEEIEKGLEMVFGSGNVDTAVKLVVALRYWMNVRESIKEWEEGKGVPVLQH